jgi:hypothetical protein
VNGIVAASNWLGQTQEDWDGLIVVVGHYELKAQVEALPDYRPNATQTEYNREFFGTYRGHPLLWLRTGQDDPIRRIYAFRMSALRKKGAGDGSVPPDLDRSAYPRVLFKEARDLTAELEGAGQSDAAKTVAESRGDIYVMAELGHVSPTIPEGRVWNLSDENAPPASTRTS